MNQVNICFILTEINMLHKLIFMIYYYLKAKAGNKIIKFVRIEIDKEMIEMNFNPL